MMLQLTKSVFINTCIVCENNVIVILICVIVCHVIHFHNCIQIMTEICLSTYKMLDNCRQGSQQREY